MARSRRRRGVKMPGVSMNTSWLAPTTAIPRSVVRVVCTLRLTMATLAPTNVLTSVDLPAFGAPIRAMNPQRVATSVSGIGTTLPYALARQERCGGRLLGGTLAGTFSARGLAASDTHLGGKPRRMVWTLTVDLYVGWQI